MTVTVAMLLLFTAMCALLFHAFGYRPARVNLLSLAAGLVVEAAMIFGGIVAIHP